MFVFDLICPGLGHIIVKRYWSGLAGLIFFLGTFFTFCYLTLVPFWNVFQTLLNDGEIPDQPFKIIPILTMLGLSFLTWFVLALDGLLRK